MEKRNKYKSAFLIIAALSLSPKVIAETFTTEVLQPFYFDKSSNRNIGYAYWEGMPDYPASIDIYVSGDVQKDRLYLLDTFNNRITILNPTTSEIIKNYQGPTSNPNWLFEIASQDQIAQSIRDGWNEYGYSYPIVYANLFFVSKENEIWLATQRYENQIIYRLDIYGLPTGGNNAELVTPNENITDQFVDVRYQKLIEKINTAFKLGIKNIIFNPDNTQIEYENNNKETYAISGAICSDDFRLIYIKNCIEEDKSTVKRLYYYSHKKIYSIAPGDPKKEIMIKNIEEDSGGYFVELANPIAWQPVFDSQGNIYYPILEIDNLKDEVGIKIIKLKLSGPV